MMTTSRRFAIDQWMMRSIGSSVRVAVGRHCAGRRCELHLVRTLRDDALPCLHALEHLGPAMGADAEPQGPAFERLAFDHDVRDLTPPILDDRDVGNCERL